MTQHLEALRRLEDGEEEWERDCDFDDHPNPRCPHCGESIDIEHHSMHWLYEDGEHEATCPFCERKFMVLAEVEYSFSTSDQRGLDT